jgi:hypothetical protein
LPPWWLFIEEANRFSISWFFCFSFLKQLCNVRLGGTTRAIAASDEFNEPHSFTIVTPQVTLYLRAESTDEMLNWITLFNNAAAQSRRRPTQFDVSAQAAAAVAASPAPESGASSSTEPANSATATATTTTAPAQPSTAHISDQNVRILAIAGSADNKKCADCRDAGS